MLYGKLLASSKDNARIGDRQHTASLSLPLGHALQSTRLLVKLSILMVGRMRAALEVAVLIGPHKTR